MTPRTTPPPWAYEALTPTSFLDRAAWVHRDRVALVEDGTVTTFVELRARARRLSGALLRDGVSSGDRVAVLAPNTRLLAEAHHGVPMAGAALVALNTRLGAGELGALLRHSSARLLLCDHELEGVGRAAVHEAGTGAPIVIAGGDGDEYESFLDADEHTMSADEMSLLAVNYTSGTTGTPKGVMYHHRGAFLQSLAMALHLRLDARSVLLWTLPMFHCNGWCFPWAAVAVGARQLLLRRPDPALVWAAIRNQGVTHFNAAPTVLTTLVTADEAADGVPDGRRVLVGTGGAPPAPALLARLAALGIDVVHLYGLTETFGPAVICDWHPEWDDEPAEVRAALQARQGVGNVIARRVRVVDHEGVEVPADGVTRGEIVLAGNDVMLGYLDDAEATVAACPDGWFRSGDVGVVHPDGYVELKDRAKDIIISGGENISSVEVEQALMTHPAVLEAAVVAAPDAHWGEVPVAFVTCVANVRVDEPELVDHVRARLAHFKAPKRVLFEELPKTSTGKIQKFVLRERLRVAAPST